MKIDDRQQLGNSGIELTAMGLSGAPFGNILVPMDEDDALETIGEASVPGR